MTEPSEDLVLLKAKQLARDEGRLRLWDSEYDQLRKARSHVADDTLRAETRRIGGPDLNQTAGGLFLSRLGSGSGVDPSPAGVAVLTGVGGLFRVA